MIHPSLRISSGFLVFRDVNIMVIDVWMDPFHFFVSPGKIYRFFLKSISDFYSFSSMKLVFIYRGLKGFISIVLIVVVSISIFNTYSHRSPSIIV